MEKGKNKIKSGHYVSIVLVIKWVLVSSTGKVVNGWIRDLGFNFNPRLHQKPIGILVW